MTRALAIASVALFSATSAWADIPTVTDGDITTQSVHGVDVIVKRVPQAEWVAAHLYIRGGVRNWTEDNAGIERLALRASVHGGTQQLGRDAFLHRLAALGADLASESNEDYSALTVNSLRGQWEESFALLADDFLHPALTDAEIELARQRQLADLKSEQDVPDSQLTALAQLFLYRDHPYQRRAIGTPASVARIDAAAVRAHLAKLRQSERLLVVVVGDVDPARVMDRVAAALGSVPRGAWREQPLPPLTVTGNQSEAIARALPTTYVAACFAGPNWRDADLAAGLATMHLLAAREFLAVRTKRNLSYAPDAWLDTGYAVPFGELYTTAVDAPTTVKVLFDEAQRLAREMPPADEVADSNAVYLTGLLMRSQKMAQQATRLARWQIYAGDWRGIRTIADRIRAVTPADVQAFAKKYFHNMRVVYLGSGKRPDAHALDGF